MIQVVVDSMSTENVTIVNKDIDVDIQRVSPEAALANIEHTPSHNW